MADCPLFSKKPAAHADFPEGARSALTTANSLLSLPHPVRMEKSMTARRAHPWNMYGMVEMRLKFTAAPELPANMYASSGPNP